MSTERSRLPEVASVEGAWMRAATLPAAVTSRGGATGETDWQHYFGAVLSHTGYRRDRDAEFARRDVPRTELLADIDAAISAAERPRYNDLVKRLRIAVMDRSELTDGYVYKLDTKKITLPEVAEWITMERLCCPFLAFQLDVKANSATQLTMRGPLGAKTVLREEFPENR